MSLNTYARCMVSFLSYHCGGGSPILNKHLNIKILMDNFSCSLSIGSVIILVNLKFISFQKYQQIMLFSKILS